MSGEPTIFSLSRAALLTRCPRRFFYRYVYAAHSLDETADPERHLARRLSRPVGLPLFFRHIVQQGLRRALTGEPWPECLYAEYRASLCRQLDRCCPLPLREWQSGENDLVKLQRSLRRGLKTFARSAAPRMLLKTAPERLHLFGNIESVEIGTILWLAAPFCRRRIGTHWEFFEFARSGLAMRSLFHRYWALQNHLPLESVRSVFIAPDGSVTRSSGQTEITPLLDSLRDDAAKMAELSLYAGAAPELVPRTGDPENCARCPYAGICSRENVLQRNNSSV